MKVLLTGATGFIGSHVVRQLLGEGRDVSVLVRRGSPRERLRDIESRLSLVEGDLLDSRAIASVVDSVRPDLCIHLAWYVEHGKYLDAPANTDYVNASLDLARSLAVAGCKRLVVTGTCFEHDVRQGTLDETSPVLPRHLYSASKLSLFLSLEQFSKIAGFELAWARLFYQYGPFEQANRLIPKVIHRLFNDQIFQPPNGELVRDYLHVEDVASAICAVAESHVTGAVNIGSAQPVSVGEIARLIGQLIEKPQLIQEGIDPPPPDEPSRIVADNSKLLKNTAWRPRWSIEEGLMQTIEWWKKQPAVK